MGGWTAFRYKPLLEVTNTFKAPHPLILMLGGVAAAAALTWVLPAGSFDRRDDPATGRRVVVAGTYHRVDGSPVGPFAAAVAVPRGFVAGAEVIGVVLFVGGAWVVVERVGTLPALVAVLVARFRRRGLWAIPVITVFFATMGALENMQEEIIPLVPVRLLLGDGLGVDAVVVVAMSAGAAIVGSAFGPTNPFQAGMRSSSRSCRRFPLVRCGSRCSLLALPCGSRGPGRQPALAGWARAAQQKDRSRTRARPLRQHSDRAPVDPFGQRFTIDVLEPQVRLVVDPLHEQRVHDVRVRAERDPIERFSLEAPVRLDIPQIAPLEGLQRQAQGQTVGATRQIIDDVDDTHAAAAHSFDAITPTDDVTGYIFRRPEIACRAAGRRAGVGIGWRMSRRAVGHGMRCANAGDTALPHHEHGASSCCPLQRAHSVRLQRPHTTPSYSGGSVPPMVAAPRDISSACIACPQRSHFGGFIGGLVPLKRAIASVAASPNSGCFIAD